MNSALLSYLETLPEDHLRMHLAAYPWFTSARVVLAKKNKALEAVQSAAVYVHDRNWFKSYYEATLDIETPITETLQPATEVINDYTEVEQDVAVGIEKIEEDTVDESQEIEDATQELPLQPKTFSDWLQQFSISKDGKVTSLNPMPKAVEESDELDKLIQSSIPYTMIEDKLDTETHYAKGLQAFINEQKNLKKTSVEIPLFDEQTKLPVTETFAKLLAAQHKYKQAIVIYEKLILKFPSKNAYFAALIKELQEKN